MKEDLHKEEEGEGRFRKVKEDLGRWRKIYRWTSDRRTRKFMELRMSESGVFQLIRDRKSRGASSW